MIKNKDLERRDFPWLCCIWIPFLVASNVTVWGKGGPAPHSETERMTAIPCHCSWWQEWGMYTGLAIMFWELGFWPSRSEAKIQWVYPQWRQRSIQEPVVNLQASGPRWQGQCPKQRVPLSRFWQGSQLLVPFFVPTHFLSLVPQYSHYFYGYLLSFQCMAFAT